MKTPYFLIYKEQLDKNINAFLDALNRYGPNSTLAYSVKTNSLPWLLKYLNQKGIVAEVVSREEYDLAKICGYDGKQIIFNGPIKEEEDLRCAFEEDAIVNIDSQRELAFLEKNKQKDISKIGIRVNINPHVFDAKDIGYIEDGFRFGYSHENGELKRAIEIIQSSYDNKTFGLHLHCNSVTRSLNVYKAITKYAANIIKVYQLNPSFIDIGGGFFGGVPGKTSADEYIEIITNQLKEVVDFNQTRLILEPGSAIIGSVVDLYTSVIDVKKTQFAHIITTDGSRIHIDPLWKKENYMYSIESHSNSLKKEKQIICGYTCMDHDRIMTIRDKPFLEIGDKIIYHRVGAYTMTFGGPFIRYFPDVYVKEKDMVLMVRKRMNVNEYFNIHYYEEEDKND